MKLIKSAVLEENRQISVKHIELPDLLSDECEVKITDAGLCSSDIERGYGGGAYFYPLVMGHELAGEIARTGSEAKGEFSKGDKVCIFPLLPCFNCSACKQKHYALCCNYDYYGSRRNGGFSDRLNVKKWNILKLPNGVSTQDGALVEPIAVALHAIKKLKINAKDKTNLCIFGAGFLGLIAVQIINNLYPKCKITLVDRNHFKLDIGVRYGAISKWVGDDKSWQLFLSESKDSFEHVIEFAGVPKTFSAALSVSAASSSVVWAGNISGDLTFSKSQVSSILRKELRINGTWNSIYKGESGCDWSDALDLISIGLQPSELISLKIKLEEIGATLGKLYDHKNRKSKFEVIKVLVNPNS
jgi:threonine dehydrogenase-like Zn-dependent dehydrogenase